MHSHSRRSFSTLENSSTRESRSHGRWEHGDVQVLENRDVQAGAVAIRRVLERDHAVNGTPVGLSTKRRWEISALREETLTESHE